MDLSSIFGTLMSNEGISGIAAKTGASSLDIKNVLSSALPQLISGADKQNTDSNTSPSFASVELSFSFFPFRTALPWELSPIEYHTDECSGFPAPVRRCHTSESAESGHGTLFPFQDQSAPRLLK